MADHSNPLGRYTPSQAYSMLTASIEARLLFNSKADPEKRIDAAKNLVYLAGTEKVRVILDILDLDTLRKLEEHKNGNIRNAAMNLVQTLEYYLNKDKRPSERYMRLETYSFFKSPTEKKKLLRALDKVRMDLGRPNDSGAMIQDMHI